VNPHGFRLYSGKYWRVNFFSPRVSYGAIALKTNALFELVHSILMLLNTKILFRSLLVVKNFKILIHNRDIFILVNVSCYWRAYRFLSLTTQNRSGVYIFPRKRFHGTSQPSRFYYNRHYSPHDPRLPYLHFLKSQGLLLERWVERFLCFNRVQLLKYKGNYGIMRALLHFFLYFSSSFTC